MSRYLCTLRYDGASFCGWQVQKNGPSVCAAVGDALRTLLRERVNVTGCGRTDAGVHALRYSFHFDTDAAFDRRRFLAGLNALLPDTVAALGVDPVPDAFHARYSALGKSYIYKIWNAPYMSPFYEGHAWFFPYALDEKALGFVGEEFCGTHDFGGFMSKGSKIKEDTVRTVKYFDVAREDELVTIRVCADGFLYNMVRIMVGTYALAAAGKLKQGDIARIISLRDRSLAGDTAPAHGLYLNKVFYPSGFPF